ncbi:MAG: glycosyltransferase [bacterium]
MDDVILLHVGDGPFNGEEQDLVNRIGLSRKVIFLGKTQDVVNVLWASDLFLMPSLYEGMPIACMEAMKCCVPPIVFQNTPRLQDLVKHNETGFCVDRSSNNYTALLLECFNTKHKLSKIDVNANGFITKKFGMIQSINMYLEILQFSIIPVTRNLIYVIYL